MIFDTHAHYVAQQFNDHREELLINLPQKGVRYVVECGTDYTSTKAAELLCRQYDYFYFAAGIHPESITDDNASTNMIYKGDFAKEMADIEAFVQNPKCVAIGECGLDYHYDIPKDKQMQMFILHLELAKKYNLPVLIHDREAHGDMYDILARYKPKGILHCYSGSADDAVRLVNDGMHIGFGGAVTFKNARRAVEAVAAVPISRIVLETDCPYMAPEPLRGKENNSAFISYTAAKIAEIKGISTEEVLKITCENAQRLFLGARV